MAVGKALRLKTATGLYLTDGALVYTKVAKTPLGMREVATETIPLGDSSLSECVAKLVEEKKLAGQIVCGVDPKRFYLITREPPTLQDDEDMEDAMAGGLAHMPGGLVSATTPVRLAGKSMMTLLAMSGDVARQTIRGLGGIKEKQLWMTGVPIALYAAARADPKPSRKYASEVRVFLHGSEAMAVLAYGGTPVALHVFDCPPDGQARALEFAARNMEARARATLGLKGLDVIYLHLGQESAELASRTADATGGHVVAAPEVSMTPQASSAALGAFGLSKKPKGFLNLFEKVFEPAGFMKNFPLLAAIMLLAITAGVGFAFAHQRSGLEVEAKALKKKAKAAYTSVGISKDSLKKAHEGLKEEYRLTKYFITDRAFWGDILKDFPDVIPPTMQVEDFHGRDTVLFPRKKKRDASVTAKLRQLSLAATAPVDAAISTPPELDMLTQAVRECDSIRQLFPRITTANTRLMPGAEQPMTRILLTVSP